MGFESLGNHVIKKKTWLPKQLAQMTPGMLPSDVWMNWP